MIKETVDAVRVAELEAEKIINTAKENGQDNRNQVKSRAEEYRTKALKEAQEKAEQEMQIVVNQCESYEDQCKKNVELKTADLKRVAESRAEKAVKAVIDALV